MEKLKSFKDILEPDVRQKNFAKFESGKFVPIEAKDVYAKARSIILSEHVPEAIHNHFATALNLLAYSWYYYPFNVTAEFIALVSVEMALKERLSSDSKLGFKKLLKKAISLELISSSGFSHISEKKEIVPVELEGFYRVDHSNYCQILVETIPELRNAFAHGTNLLHPNGHNSVRICAEIINQLFCNE